MTAVSDRLLSTLQSIWGYSQFRPPQEAIAHCLLSQRDALIIMPTGGGKSICFQLPALLQPGLTLVVSPLVALMENQVQELRRRQLPAALLHSELPPKQRQQTLRALEKQQLKLLYVSPETLLSAAVWERLSQPEFVISSLVLDEAHCLVQWGDSFRPAYYRLGAVRSALLRTKPPGSRMAIAAFTATADPTAQQTIVRILQLRQPQRFTLSPYRANLHLTVQTVWTPRGRRQRLLQYMRERSHQAGLVYVRTRRDSETLAAWFNELGYPTAAYHAGLSPEERRQIETAWLQDDFKFVVCTCAFGMGIDKGAVRWVVHFHAPSLLSEYVQEVGRGGRDGKPTEALTLISERTGWLDPDDQQRRKFFEETVRSQQKTAQTLIHQLPPQGTVESVTRQFPGSALALAWLHGQGQLQWDDPFSYRIKRNSHGLPGNSIHATSAQQMVDFLHTRQCRWQFLLQAFGCSRAAHGFNCGHCDNCVS